MKTQRREFLRHIAAGGAIVTIPTFLQGCGIAPAITVAEPVPEDPFLDWFQIDQEILARLMTELTAKGADLAELYFQHRRRSVLRMQDGEIDRSNVDILQGVGMRVVRGDGTGFAFTEDLSLAAMLATARTAAATVLGESGIPASRFSSKPVGASYITSVAWADIGIDQKLPVLQRVDDKARGLDPSIDTVTASP